MSSNFRDGQRIVSKLEYCRELRYKGTNAENLLWRYLRGERFHGIKYRRQHQFGPYILDFYCPKHKLAIEVDGAQHNEPDHAERDAERTSYLKTKGIRVLRFNNVEVLNELQGVLDAIGLAIEDEQMSAGRS